MKFSIKKFACLFIIIALVCPGPSWPAADTLRPAALDERRADPGEDYYNQLDPSDKLTVTIYAIKNFHISLQGGEIGEAGGHSTMISLLTNRTFFTHDELTLTGKTAGKLPIEARYEVYHILAGAMMGKISQEDAIRRLVKYYPKGSTDADKTKAVKTIVGELAKLYALPFIVLIRMGPSALSAKMSLKHAIENYGKNFVVVKENAKDTIEYFEKNSRVRQRITAVIIDLDVIEHEELSIIIKDALRRKIAVYVISHPWQTLPASVLNVIEEYGSIRNIVENQDEEPADLAYRILSALGYAVSMPVRPVRPAESAV